MLLLIRLTPLEQSGATEKRRVLIFAQVRCSLAFSLVMTVRVSQMKEMLDIIETDLFAKHMPTVRYLRLDGAGLALKSFAH